MNEPNGKPDRKKIPKNLKSVAQGMQDFNDTFLDNLESIAGSLEVLAEIEKATKDGLFPPGHFEQG